jgi:hypothetical protein
MNATEPATIDRNAVNRELCDRFGRKPESVAKWSDALALTVLYSSRRDERIALNRAARAAGEEPEEPGEPSGPERIAAAGALEEIAEKGSIHEVVNVVSFTVYTLPNQFVRKLAERMAVRLREAADGR